MAYHDETYLPSRQRTLGGEVGSGPLTDQTAPEVNVVSGSPALGCHHPPIVTINLLVLLSLQGVWQGHPVSGFLAYPP